jgi:hypothetical protein
MQITQNYLSPFSTTAQSGASKRDAASTVAPSSSDTTSAGGIDSYDFTSMTPKDLLSTVNNLVTSGKMSLKNSSPLLTIAGFANGGGLDGTTAGGTDKPVDVLAALQAGIDFKEQSGQAQQPNSGIQNWKNALATLQGLQGTISGVDTYA